MNHERSFGRWVQHRRKALDLTQKELAQRVPCARVTVQKIESGHLRPSRHIAERFVYQLGVPVQERAAFVQWARQGTAPPCIVMAEAEGIDGDNTAVVVSPSPLIDHAQLLRLVAPSAEGRLPVAVLVLILATEPSDCTATCIAELLASLPQLQVQTLSVKVAKISG